MQITPRRLSIDLSSLWLSQSQRFILRYQDISEFKQNELAGRIKRANKIRTVRRENGPTKEIIKQILLEINPILYAEAPHRGERNGYYNDDTYRTFNVYAVHTISGWVFKNLCQAIYYIACRRRRLTRDEVYRIADLTTFNHEEIDQLLDREYPNPERNQEPQETVSEITMEDIENARMNLPH